MAVGLSWEQVQDPAYAFEQGAGFVSTFGVSIGADLINPVTRPMEYAEAVARLNPRHPESVFKQPGAESEEYADRYAMADNGLPAWAADHEDVINATAHTLGVRDKELGTTFAHSFSPLGHFAVGVVLEGANRASEIRGNSLAEALRTGLISVDRVVVVGTGRAVAEREGHGDIRDGFGVADKVTALLHENHPDLFDGEEAVPLESMHIRTRSANTRDVVTEVALRLGVDSILMSGSNIYGSWMRTDMATVQHNLGLEKIGFGAGQDDPKAARTPLIWAAEVAQTLVSAAHLQHARNTKK